MKNKFLIVLKLVVAFSLIYSSLVGFSNVYAARSKNVTRVSSHIKKHKVSKPGSQIKPMPSTGSAPTPVALGAIPAAPDFDVKSYILIDANSGYVIAEKNATQQVTLASLTKLMTLYLAASALQSGKIHLTDQVTVSEKAWRTSGSRMFIRVGTNVSIQDLIRGIATASGNDAAVAMAEHLAGSEQAFVDLMNQTARNLKMKETNYADSSGYADVGNYSTAADLAILTRNWISSFPKYYPWFKEKWIVYNGIKQPNRNRLLWRDSSVDGIKTGHTREAGYCLIASAKRNGMRLVSIVMGAKNDNARINDSMALLNYGFRFFETRKLFDANTKIVASKTLFSKNKVTELGMEEDYYVTLPIGQYKNLKACAVIDSRLQAPILKGKPYGTLKVSLDNKVIVSKPLIALQDNPRANFFSVVFDYIWMWFQRGRH